MIRCWPVALLGLTTTLHVFAARGAESTASNMQTRADSGEPTATILRVSQVGLSALRLTQVGALGITSEAPPFPPVPGESPVHGTIFDWYSRKAPEPVIGWLGGNVLKAFRLTIDFPRRMTYWERERGDDAHDLDQVGITLETRDGQTGYFVAGLAGKNGAPTVEGVRVGDRLLQVDGQPLDRLTRGRIFSALHGKSGTVHLLLLERDGRRVTVRAKTVAF